MATLTSLQAFGDIRRIKDMYLDFALAYPALQKSQSAVTFNSPDDTAATQRGSAQVLAQSGSAFAGAISSNLQLALGEWIEIVRSSSTDLNTKLSEIAEYFGDNSIEVRSRGTVYNAPAAGGGNVGSSELMLCATNKWDQVIESSSIETITFKCLGSTRDLSQIGRETYYGQGGGFNTRSQFNDGGVGVPNFTIAAVNPGTSDSILQNPSFDSAFRGTGTDKIPSWIIASGESNITQQSNYAQDRGRGANQRCLRIAGDCIFRQDLRALGIDISPAFPYLIAYRYRRDGSTSGTITVKLGSSGTGYTDAETIAGTSGVWGQVNVDPDTHDAWVANFNTDGQPFLEFEVSSFSGTWIEIDDVLLIPMTLIGGRFLSIISGLTAAVAGDEFSQETLLTTGSGEVDLTAGASGSVDSITVDGVELLRTAIAYDSSLAQTAANVAAEINDPENVTNPRYRAEVLSGAAVTIYPIRPVTGTLTVTSASTTLTTADTDVTGGALGEIQDMLVRNTGYYLPHASSPTSGYDD